MGILSKAFIVDPALYDLSASIAGIEEIRKQNKQRFEMEQLTAIVFEDTIENRCVGYKDITRDDFWVRGHMPVFALMPGVIMCEAAAQLASYYATKNKLIDGTLGFAGLEDVRFRGMVVPGNRFVIQARMIRIKKPLITAEFMCIVDDSIICKGIVKGVSLTLPSDV